MRPNSSANGIRPRIRSAEGSSWSADCHVKEVDKRKIDFSLTFRWEADTKVRSLSCTQKKLDIPRFVHHPMGLIQTCEFILLNFYPSKFVTIMGEPAWVQYSEGARGGPREIVRSHLHEYFSKTPAKASFYDHCSSSVAPDQPRTAQTEADWGVLHAPSVAAALSRWAIRSSTNAVLDPSFGGWSVL